MLIYNGLQHTSRHVTPLEHIFLTAANQSS